MNFCVPQTLSIIQTLVSQHGRSTPRSTVFISREAKERFLPRDAL